VPSKRKTPKDRHRERDSVIVRWGKKINWERRVKAVCKPCWELKYCPYGPLVEQFPLEHGEFSCRIFGHDCPVFYVAEPLTETKELRNISRTIPRTVQFRVLKRENQICNVCGHSVQDADVEFDHIIPWSKGGSSDESNIRLLCRPCNRKRRADFEKEFLIRGLGEHLAEPVDESVVKWMLCVISFGLDFEESQKGAPTAKDYAKEWGNKKTPGLEDREAWSYGAVKEFFASERPTDLPELSFQALKLRWGFADGKMRPLRAAAEETDCDIGELLSGERDLLRRLGWMVKTTKTVEKKWLAT
jgi:HNH endonuclease